MAKSRKHAIRPRPYPIPSPSTPIPRYDTPNSVESTPPQTIHSPHSYVLHPSEFREVLQSRDAYPISMDQVMKWLDYTQRSSLIALMKRNFSPNVHYVRTPKSSKESKTYFFTVESFKEMCKLRRNGERKKLAEAWSTAESLYGIHVPSLDKKNPFDKHKIEIEDDDDDEDEEDEFVKESKDKHNKEISDDEDEDDSHSSVSSPVPSSPMKRRSMTGLVALDKKEMLYHSNDEDEDSEYTTSSESDDEPFTIREKSTPHRVITHNHNTRIIHNVSPSKPSTNSLSNSSNSIQATQQNSNVSNNNNNNNNNNAHTSTTNNKPSNLPNSPSVASATSNQASSTNQNQNQSTQQNSNNNNTTATTTTHTFQWTENNARLEHILKVIDSSVPLIPISSHYSSFTLPNTYTTHTPSTFLTSLTNIASLVEMENSSSIKAHHTNSTAQDFVRDSMHNTASFHSHYRTSTQLCDLTPLLVE